MFKLDRLEILGFKSFGDKTELRFPTGITAVVGPNGCGKSNIGDAINWVLGEQSAKMLRGKQMADVIFNGCESRKPLGMAQVTLEFAGAEGIDSAENGRIKISRRLFRSGESDYLLNGQRARLKDIHEILEQGRVGARSYATIEQGRIDQILNAKPKDRRVLIEDAAGISGYKHKRRLTELKLEATHANLLRVNDIVVEVERQIRSLKRQAGKARRYRELREQLRERDQIRFGLRSIETDRQLEKLRAAEQAAADAEVEGAASLGRSETELTDERESLTEASQEFRARAEELHGIDIAAERSETQIRTSKERIEENDAAADRQLTEVDELATQLGQAVDRRAEQQSAVARGREEIAELEGRAGATREARREAEQERDAVVGEIESLRRRQFESMNRAAECRNRVQRIEEAVERNDVQVKRLEQEREAAREDQTRLESETVDLDRERERQRGGIEELRTSLVATEQRMGEARVHHTELSAALAEARESEGSVLARLETLEDVATRFAGVSDGVRTLLGEGRDAGVRTMGVVADYIEAGRDVEGAAESYLRSFLPTVVVEDDDDLERAAHMLRESGAGRTSLIGKTRPRGGLAVGAQRNGSGSSPDMEEDFRRDDRVLGRLSDRLRLRNANGFLADRIGEAWFVRDLKAALELHRRHPTADYLTTEGDVVFASGIVTTGGRESDQKGLLAHNRQVHEAQAEAARVTAEVAELGLGFDAATEQVAGLERAEREQRDELAALERVLLQLELRFEQSTEERAKTLRRTDVLSDELDALGQEAQDLREQLSRSSGEVEQAETTHREVEALLADQIALLATREERLKELGETDAGLRAELAARQQRQEGDEQEAERLSGHHADLDRRVNGLRDGAAQARQRAAETRELLQNTESDLVSQLERREELRRTTAEMERSIAERQRRLTEAETALRGLRNQVETLREGRRQAELDRVTCENSRSHLDEMCQHELGISASDAAVEAGEALEGVDLEALESEVAEVRGKIERIGPVNMTAIEEFTELEERHGFLTSQRTDLEESMTSLRDTIKKINRTTRDRFEVAFNAIRASFQEVFVTLFNGGRADLRLEEGEDVLEAGIEMMVQPPGKRLGSVQLMSGGEKALSAIALLFSIFRYQPSPFCLLDEVDAALDDSNVVRFTRLLEEYSGNTQFVVVTHNKLSMESANLLYGVTMEEPGVSKLVSMELQ